MKKVLSLLLIILTILSVTACVTETPADTPIDGHNCESICIECNKCENAACTEDACAEKCGGHHKCESACAECNKCTDTTCTEDACADKCGGHHKCESACAECNKCTNTACTEDACKNKCGGHHKCESICKECKKCTDTACTEEACADKCGGHHKCGSVCKECKKCTDSACKEDTCKDKCGGHHKCESACKECKKCTDAACTEKVCADKCGGHKEEVPEFTSGDKIVKDKYEVTVGDIVFTVEGKAFLRGNIKDLIAVAVDTMEKVSGNKFINSKNYSNPYNDNKVHLNVRREGMYVEYDLYQGSSYNDYGSAYAGSPEHAVLTPGYIMDDDYTIIHELSHVLMLKQTDTFYCQLLNEGYAEYTSYLALQELEKADPAYRIHFKPSEYLLMNLELYDYGELYKHPIEYWFDNTFEYASNNNYAVGFRFMWYLDTVYGSYTKWLDVIDSMYPYKPVEGGTPTTDQQVKALKAAYGDDVMDGFYPWLKKNLDKFQYNYKDSKYTELSGVMNIYPTFDALEPRMVLENIEYTDLYINLEQARYYLEEYMNFDSSNLLLKVSTSDGKVPTVNLYKADGSFVTVKTNKPISLEGISYIKLVGTCKAAKIEITGFSPR